MSMVRRCILFVCLAIWSIGSHAQNPATQGTAVVAETEKSVEVQVSNAAWKPATVGLALAVRDRLRTGEFSRAAVRFTDLSMLRVDELTTIEISPPVSGSGKQTLDVKRGGTYFFQSRQGAGNRNPHARGKWCVARDGV